MTLAALRNMPHGTRAVAFVTIMLAAIPAWSMLVIGRYDRDMPIANAVALVLLPLVPGALLDLWLRLGWQPALATVYPPPPGPGRRLVAPEYGLYCLPVPLFGTAWCFTAWSFLVAFLFPYPVR